MDDAKSWGYVLRSSYRTASEITERLDEFAESRRGDYEKPPADAMCARILRRMLYKDPSVLEKPEEFADNYSARLRILMEVSDDKAYTNDVLTSFPGVLSMDVGWPHGFSERALKRYGEISRK